jgi:hypothetical protein
LPAQLAAFAASAASAASRSTIPVAASVTSPRGAVVCAPRLDIAWHLSISKRSAGGWRFWFSRSREETYVPIDLGVKASLTLETAGERRPAQDVTWMVELPEMFSGPANPADVTVPNAPPEQVVFLRLGAGRRDVLAIHLLDQAGKLQKDPVLRYRTGETSDRHFPSKAPVPLQPILDAIEELRSRRRSGAVIAMPAAAEAPPRAVVRQVARAYTEMVAAVNAVAGPQTLMLPPSQYDLDAYEANLSMGVDEDGNLAETFDEEAQRVEAHFAIAGARRPDARVAVSPAVIVNGPGYDAFFSALTDPAVRPGEEIKKLAELLSPKTGGVKNITLAHAFAVAARDNTVLVRTGATEDGDPVFLVRMCGTLGASDATLLFAAPFEGRDADMQWDVGDATRLAIIVEGDKEPTIERKASRWFFKMLFNTYIWAQRLAP